mmetsp:Transcript_9913/g.16458  ORF Transcript_9913/g.16458 Transcript_9913/m.16458 type:complete len:1323 (-) Transcript_9913:243-4211(-)|eukprot:CAMPEP_0114414288 /NCGR_PEP_ID=MMETSP0103-20121206/1309_1 /TAXON_ID=37642 ORGANISM="Paraphysomonas imperforata, Strain PA2" /NCGR_SAMPLE_ID=MMETSP0103 /ASSEMBLY_ACC=CAM_ASM_000201 /LENGTH=1322 /DNA_ID=CAMNT_0001582421 /DNA_START=101 /DNA_END=4069 /DNA_ORIENTATION=+
MTDNESEKDSQYLIAVSFEGLLISSKSSLHKTSLSKIWNTGVKSETNVKRSVKIQKSPPFIPGGRPDSLLYDTVYESEEIEEINEALLPSLIAVLENPHDKDCKVRINVYYSSTLSKEPLIMASTSFNLRDFLRAKKETYSSIMGSEHCRAPIAHVRLLDKLPETLSTEAISSRSGPKDWNPLEQKYVFQREEGLPPCYCEELTAEARLAFKMPQLFLKNFANILSESIVVWTKRAHLERMRVGNFSSREEAYANGWYEVSIAVGGCNITATHVEVESSSFNDVLEAWTATSSEPVGGGSREPGAREERLDDREVIKPSSYVTVAVEDRNRAFRTPVGRTNTEYNSLEPTFGRNRNIHLVKNKNRNTSEFQVHPKVQGGCAHLTSLETVLGVDTTSQEQDHDFEVITSHQTEVTDRPMSTSRNTRKSSRSSSAALPKDTAFQVYVPFLKGAKVIFEVKFEDIGTGKGTLVGGCSFSLDDVMDSVTQLEAPDVKQLFLQRQVILPLQVVNTEPSPQWEVHHGSISVAINVNQHPAGQSSKAPPLSPFIPHAKTADFVNNSMLSSARHHQPSNSRSDTSSPRLSSSSESEEGVVTTPCEEINLPPPPPIRRSSRRISLIQKSNTVEYQSDDSDEEGGITVDVLAPPSSSPSAKQRLSPEKGPGTYKAKDPTAPPIMNMRHDDTSQLITDCYEFMWHLGYKGTDPLLLEKEDHSPNTSGDNTAELREAVDNTVLNMESISLSDVSPVALRQANDRQNDPSLVERVDVSYSQTFLWDYIYKLQNMFSHMLMLISACEEEIDDGCTFRPSRLKKEIEFQPLPINFHYQVMTVQPCTSADRVKDKESKAGFWVNPPNKNPIIVWDSVTCGSFSAHACPHKKGGLTRILSEIGNQKDNLSKHRDEFVEKVVNRRGGDKNQCDNTRPKSVGSTKSIDEPNWNHAFSPFGPEASHLASLSMEAENFETSLLNTVLRRMYSVSQALSVAVNCFIMKLELVIENYVHSTFIERWMTHGFLIVHECLLSVSGKERTMIEDTWMAIETLKNFTIRLLPSPQDEQYRESNSWLAQNCNGSPGERKIQSSTWWHSVCADGRADVNLIGREVQVFVPRSIVEQLPGKVRAAVETEGAIFSFTPVLFSQGIDIMQTIATTWDSNDDIGDFQLHINIKGFERLNSYCEKVQPCASGPEASSFYSKSFVPHPLTSQLLQLVRTTDTSEKNVQMLIEVERICSMVGGCRVTFCKSGKDRTGMAITLEQSRLLGEVFGTGTTDERIIRDADVMRIHGTRIMIAEKNIGKPVYSINLLQVKFLPLFYRPPLSVTENLIKAGDNS